MPRIAWTALVLISGLFSACTNSEKVQRSADELSRLRSMCASQARQFESSWRKELGPAYGLSIFNNHYNMRDGRCYVHISSGNEFGHHEVVMDAMEGVNGPEVAWRKILNDLGAHGPGADHNPNSEKDDSKTLAKIAALMNQ